MIDLLPLVAAASSVAEYPAARMIADALATELVDAKPLWPRMRMACAEMARGIARQARIDARMLNDEDALVLHEYAADLEGAAVDLEREHERLAFDESKLLVRRFGRYPESRRTGIMGMRTSWIEWQRLAQHESLRDRIARRNGAARP